MPTGKFSFALDEELSEGDVVAITVATPDGRTLQLYSEVELRGRIAILRQFAIYGLDIGAGQLGSRVLRRLAQAVMEEFDVDVIRIEEARRTSGANPGRSLTLEFQRL
jgi:hypothetical protein